VERHGGHVTTGIRRQLRTHKARQSRTWWPSGPDFPIHYTHLRLWLKQVERLVWNITQRAIARQHLQIKELIGKIKQFIAAYN